jgi:hypothetical protein
LVWLAKTLQKRRFSVSKLTIRIIPILVLFLLAGVKQASAQGFSAYFGVGTAQDGPATNSGCPSKQVLDELTGNCEPAPNIGGVFGVFGADFMILPHLGINGEYSFRFAQAPYLTAIGLNARPQFYDFNAVYQPSSGTSRIVPVLEGGIGGARLAFYATQQCSITGINCTSSSPAGFNANHFQIHGAIGVKLYVKSDIFIKPQVDLHWVPNLDQQYSSNFVPQYTISVGYTFGRH